MTILIENLQEKIEVKEVWMDLIHRVVEESFKQEGFESPVEVSITLVDDREIKEINKEHRNIDKPTDVLSFPMVEFFEGKMIENVGDYDREQQALLLGDIVISLEKALEQSKEYGHSFERELAFLTCHGVFHLLGYDHEEEAEEKNMIQKQEAVLSSLGLKR